MIEILLPFPNRQLQPNSPCNWKAKARLVKANRLQVRRQCILFEVIPSEPMDVATVQFHFRRKTAHRMDKDNALGWLKSTIDGLVDAGIFSDDKELTYPPITQSKEKDKFGVLVTITESE